MAVRTLRLIESGTIDDEAAPALERGPVKGGRMKVAFSTSDMKAVNAHFAGARTFAIWEISADEANFVEAVQFDNASSQSGKHGDDGEERIMARIRALDGCALLFCKAIGGPAAAKVVRHNVHPVKLPTEEDIPEVIARVQTMMRGNPPPWLRKVMLQARGESGSLDFMDDED